MEKNTKIFVITLSVVVVSIVTYFGVKAYQIKKAYQTISTDNEVLEIVEEKTKDLGEEMEIDEAIIKASEDVPMGTDDEENEEVPTIEN
jgi:hypothetical protein